MPVSKTRGRCRTEVVDSESKAAWVNGEEAKTEEKHQVALCRWEFIGHRSSDEVGHNWFQADENENEPSEEPYEKTGWCSAHS